MHKPHRYVMLSVSDTGIGIGAARALVSSSPFSPPKNAARELASAWQPCAASSRQGGGQIWVYSEPGRGAAFKIYLPGAVAKVGLDTPLATDTTPPPRQGTTVIEDDDLMRSLTRQILQEPGNSAIEVQAPTPRRKRSPDQRIKSSGRSPTS